MQPAGPGSEDPVTFTEVLYTASKEAPNSPALRVKYNDQWVTWTYKNYWSDAKRFAKSLISLNIQSKKATNILGFNSPEWIISFAGAILAGCVPIGVYTTNDIEACFYIADHSEAEVIVVQNSQQLEKYTKIWDRYTKIRAFVVYWPDENTESFK